MICRVVDCSVEVKAWQGVVFDDLLRDQLFFVCQSIQSRQSMGGPGLKADEFLLGLVAAGPDDSLSFSNWRQVVAPDRCDFVSWVLEKVD